MQPLITVITPAYYSQYLCEAISSVLEQTYSKIEYIVTDDGSENFDINKIENYINNYKKDNIVSYKIIHHEKNMGTVRNLNYALRLCKGEYIFNLAADDLFADKYILEKWVQDMRKKDSYFSVACCQKFIGNLTETEKVVPFEYQKNLLLSRDKKKIFGELAVENFIYGCTVARSRKCLEEFGLYDEAYRLVEDYPYVLAYVRKGGRIDLFDCVAVKYRKGGISSSGRFNLTYEQDSDRIFQKEILPYVKYKRLYKNIYFQWKKNQISGFWEKNAACNTIEKILLYLKNPVQLYISIHRFFLKKYYKNV